VLLLLVNKSCANNDFSNPLGNWLLTWCRDANTGVGGCGGEKLFCDKSGEKFCSSWGLKNELSKLLFGIIGVGNVDTAETGCNTGLENNEEISKPARPIAERSRDCNGVFWIGKLLFPILTFSTVPFGSFLNRFNALPIPTVGLGREVFMSVGKDLG